MLETVRVLVPNIMPWAITARHYDSKQYSVLHHLSYTFCLFWRM